MYASLNSRAVEEYLCLFLMPMPRVIASQLHVIFVESTPFRPAFHFRFRSFLVCQFLVSLALMGTPPLD